MLSREPKRRFARTRSVGAFVLALSLIVPHITVAAVPAAPVASGLPIDLIIAATSADVVQVDHRARHGVRRDRNRREAGPNRNRRIERQRARRQAERQRIRQIERQRARRHAERRYNQPRYRGGHRGYPDYRQGYRRSNDGWWYPLAAFALGAVILDQQNRNPVYVQPRSQWNHIPSGSLRAHDNWCDQRYRSYDRSSKTFQPYNGQRKYCNSPYDLI